jgi:methylated-DNA-protein-cysteine methyltransferase-like protein
VRNDREPLRRLVYAAVRKIPRGRVATYGQIAAAIGWPRAARAVGRALATLPEPLAQTVPWQRVVNAAGGISRRDPEAMARQRELLSREGVRFRGRDRVDLSSAAWLPARRPRGSSFPKALARDDRQAPHGAESSGPARIRRAR